MNVGILGLGLIGGSLARAYALEGHTVYAIQRNESMLSLAMLSGAVHGKLNEETIPKCDLILLAIYPGGCADWLERNAHLVSKSALVLDCCGIKREVCARCFPLAKQYGFTFVGGHPMAGSQFSGFKYSRADLFDGAPMVLVPPVFDDIELFDRLRTLLQGFYTALFFRLGQIAVHYIIDTRVHLFQHRAGVLLPGVFFLVAGIGKGGVLHHLVKLPRHEFLLQIFQFLVHPLAQFKGGGLLFGFGSFGIVPNLHVLVVISLVNLVNFAGAVLAVHGPGGLQFFIPLLTQGLVNRGHFFLARAVAAA